MLPKYPGQGPRDLSKQLDQIMEGPLSGSTIWGIYVKDLQTGDILYNRNGDKALLYLTDASRAVHVPTTEGYSIILSPADPDAFVAAMHSLGRRP